MLGTSRWPGAPPWCAAQRTFFLQHPHRRMRIGLAGRGIPEIRNVLRRAGRRSCPQRLHGAARRNGAARRACAASRSCGFYFATPKSAGPPNKVIFRGRSTPPVSAPSAGCCCTARWTSICTFRRTRCSFCSPRIWPPPLRCHPKAEKRVRRRSATSSEYDETAQESAAESRIGRRSGGYWSRRL